jgi:hypothetical protein
MVQYGYNATLEPKFVARNGDEHKRVTKEVPMLRKSLFLAVILFLLSFVAVFAQTATPPADPDAQTVLISAFAAVFSFAVGYVLKRGAPILKDLAVLLNTYQELGVIAVALVSLVERKYAELDGHAQFEMACAAVSGWTKNALTPDEIESLVESAYNIAKALFAKDWEKLRAPGGVAISEASRHEVDARAGGVIP